MDVFKKYFMPNMRTIQNDIKNCPFCSSKNLTMRKVKKRGISYKDKKVIKGIFYVWECKECHESFFKNWNLKKDGKEIK